MTDIWAVEQNLLNHDERECDFCRGDKLFCIDQTALLASTLGQYQLRVIHRALLMRLNPTDNTITAICPNCGPSGDPAIGRLAIQYLKDHNLLVKSNET